MVTPSHRITNFSPVSFLIGTSSFASQQIVRYLLTLKHRKCAFISSDHAAQWSQSRLQHISETFSAAGFDDAIVPFILSAHEYRKAYLPEAEKHTSMKPLLNYYRKLRAKLPPAYGEHLDIVFEETTANQWAFAEIYSQLIPLFDKALANKKITAWIMANDFNAVLALRYLKKQGIDVPRQLSVISFDDSRESVRGNITSFNFNIGGNATAMINYILRRKNFSLLRSKRMVEIDGALIVRETTGRAKTKAR